MTDPAPRKFKFTVTDETGAVRFATDILDCYIEFPKQDRYSPRAFTISVIGTEAIIGECKFIEFPEGKLMTKPYSETDHG